MKSQSDSKMLPKRHLEQAVERHVHKKGKNVGKIKENQIQMTQASPKWRVELQRQVVEDGEKMADHVVKARDYDHQSGAAFCFGGNHVERSGR